ncbi:MAG: YebC/PmpR family DNA-binding transcriptional regulator [Patescibacteria group bacterium]
MSGHSKWHSIRRQKEATDQKRGKIFTKLAKGISVAAREGGGDPEMNFQLRVAISRAKAANMPKDNIERAISKGTGEGSDAVFEELLYEGLGPEKIPVVIKVLTDNRNRAVSDIKHLLSKSGGSLGSSGSVMWQFDYRGVILSEQKEITERIEEVLLESGALDYTISDEGIEIITEPQELDTVRKHLEENDVPITSAELAYIPKETQTPQNANAWQKFIDMLDDLDDVDSFFTTAEDV